MQNTLGLTILKKIEKSQMRIHKDVGLIMVCLYVCQIISKGLLVSSNSPNKGTNKFVFTTKTNSFVHLLGEFKDTKRSFQNYLTFRIKFLEINSTQLKKLIDTNFKFKTGGKNTIFIFKLLYDNMHNELKLFLRGH